MSAKVWPWSNPMNKYEESKKKGNSKLCDWTLTCASEKLFPLFFVLFCFLYVCPLCFPITFSYYNVFSSIHFNINHFCAGNFQDFGNLWRFMYFISWPRTAPYSGVQGHKKIIYYLFHEYTCHRHRSDKLKLYFYLFFFFFCCCNF